MPASRPGTAAAILGARYAPRLCPATKTRAGSIPGLCRRSRIAATASSVVSSRTVMLVTWPAIAAPCVSVRLSYRRTAFPADARPYARSRRGLFGPIVSSRSWGPQPAMSTTAGNGPAPVGIVSVPGSAHGVEPTVMSVSLKVPGRT
jgi:hypothetical protein